MSRFFFWDRLGRFGANIALEDGQCRISYAELEELCIAFARRLPDRPQLVALQACNRIEAVVAYLACLRAGHPVIPLNPESIEDGRIVATYKPDWLYRYSDGQWILEPVGQEDEASAFGDELAVLLSTSGTTGAPKLVKLSRTNVHSNAEAIADYLGLGPSECALTTLNFFYSYGMAVLNSHLAVGGRIVLTDTSVTTPEFWALFNASGGTSLALVPYHFELLDRVGFEDIDLPTLRYVTQAGGRLHADRLDKYALLARQRGWDLYVMYGQTEASPRISFVPPADLADNLQSIGRPIPGGSLDLLDDSGRSIDAPGEVGELVYRGPNVMLGYAQTRSDLQRGRDTFELRTGDLAERQPNGYFRIVGRLNRFIKLYGLRINLDDMEGRLREAGFQVYCTGTDAFLLLVHEGELHQDKLIQTIVDRWPVQRPDIAVMRVDAIPLLPSGKVNYASMLSSHAADPRKKAASVQDAFEEAFGRPVNGSDTFVSLDGDSLLYLHLSLSLERILGHIPENWERMPIAELATMSLTPSRMRSLPFEPVVRCIAIIGILTNHLETLGRWSVGGGALTLLFLVGVSFARIHGQRLAEGDALGFLRSSITKIVVLYYIIISVYFVFMPTQFSGQEISWYLFYANFNERWDYLYPYWFICVYVQLALLLALLWSVPLVQRKLRDRQALFGQILLIAALGIAIWASATSSPEFLGINTLAVAYTLALGWCVYFAKTNLEKLAYSSVIILSVLLVWRDDPVQSNLFFSVLTLSVIWVRSILLPHVIVQIFTVIAASSFYIYLLHIIPIKSFEYLNLHQDLPRLVYWFIGIGASLALGIAAAQGMPRIERGIRRVFQAARSRQSK